MKICGAVVVLEESEEESQVVNKTLLETGLGIQKYIDL